MITDKTTGEIYCFHPCGSLFNVIIKNEKGTTLGSYYLNSYQLEELIAKIKA